MRKSKNVFKQKFTELIELFKKITLDRWLAEVRDFLVEHDCA